MFKYLKLKSKLLLSFFIVTLIATGSTTVFSIYYFSGKIQSEAVENMRRHLQVAELLYRQRVEDFQQSVVEIAEDRTLRILVQALITQKIEEYLADFLHTDGLHQVLVSNADFDLLGQASSAQLALPAPVLAEHPLLKHLADGLRLAGRKRVLSAVTLEQIDTPQGPRLSLTAAAVIFKSGQIVSREAPDQSSQLTGFVLVRQVLDGNREWLAQIQRLLGVSVAVFYHGQAISFSHPDGVEPAPPAIDLTLYQQIIDSGAPLEQGRLRAGSLLAEYLPLADSLSGKTLAVLSISIGADKYLATLHQAVWNLLGIMLLCLIGAFVLGYLLARSILVPVRKLLDGVKRVSSGELSYEIVTDIRDELGVLASAFNGMARQLNELFETLEQRVENATHKLQNTLAHLAAIIDNMPDGLVVTDPRQKIIRLNPALSALFPGQEILGQSCDKLNPALAELANKSQQVVDSVHTAEITLSHQRIGQAVVSAILERDTFAEAPPNHYAGSNYLGSVVLIRDITREKELDRMMQNTIRTLTHIGSALSAERNLDKLLEMIVVEACNASYADGGTLYILENNYLHFAIVLNKSMNMFMGGTSANPISLPPLPLNETKIATYCALRQEIVHAPDVYENREFDFSGTLEYDRLTGYKTHAMIAVPLIDRMNQTVGVLQLINPIDPKSGEPGQFDKNQIEIIFSLASQAAVALENARNYAKIERKNAAFQRFVPTEFLRHLGKSEVEEIGLGDASQEFMSVLFSDIRAFTHLSEGMTPADNFQFLNHYLQFIGPSILDNGGFIDKYIGDAIMALFSGQKRNVAEDAVAAAVGMRIQLRAFNCALSTASGKPSANRLSISA